MTLFLQLRPRGGRPLEITSIYQYLAFKPVDVGRFDAVGADYVMRDSRGIHVGLVSRPGRTHTAVDCAPPPDYLALLGWHGLVPDGEIGTRQYRWHRDHRGEFDHPPSLDNNRGI